MKEYGKELILDIHDCDSTRFNRKNIDAFFKDLCKKIDMEKGKRFWWDYEGYPEEYEKAPPHLKGISAVQFIKTSSIVIHTLDELKKVYLNIFSCKDFEEEVVILCALDHFKGIVIRSQTIKRN